MVKPFDTALKHLLEAHPADYLRLVDLPTNSPIDVIDADLATVSAEADKVLRINDRAPWLMHFELQASYDGELPQRMLRYNVLLRLRHGLPVRSMVILLRPKADGPEMTGLVRHLLDNKPYLEFQYGVMRLWRKPVGAVLAAGVGTLPLVPLAEVGPAELPSVIQQMKQRLGVEATASEQAVIWTETYVLMGLRYDQALANTILKGIREMEESVTYQEIIKKGKAEGKAEGKVEGQLEEARRILLILGTDAFGQPNAATETAIAALIDPKQLEELIQRISKAKSWQELLAKPRTQRRNGRKGR